MIGTCPLLNRYWVSGRDGETSIWAETQRPYCISKWEVSPAVPEVQGDALHMVAHVTAGTGLALPREHVDEHVAEPCLAVLSSKLSRACAAAREQSGG